MEIKDWITFYFLIIFFVHVISYFYIAECNLLTLTIIIFIVSCLQQNNSTTNNLSINALKET
jgi:hypothetical protein